jgi:hypothetical protein
VCGVFFSSFKFISLIFFFQRFSDVLFIDAITAESAASDLRNIALTKGVGSPKSTLKWLSQKNEEWLLVIDNADDSFS